MWILDTFIKSPLKFTFFESASNSHNLRNSPEVANKSVEVLLYNIEIAITRSGIQSSFVGGYLCWKVEITWKLLSTTLSNSKI